MADKEQDAGREVRKHELAKTKDELYLCSECKREHSYNLVLEFRCRFHGFSRRTSARYSSMAVCNMCTL